ncbi:hypothetical protein BROUX41_000443 [Berkeleyomyces rouxiae]|uniref:uncharacterized protein n=1 Tax=Berkeleyomyces rouxiae TaxID=2035830 RepID=UPI003B766A09
MVPRRRSRLVLVAAFIITVLIYKGTEGSWDSPSAFNQKLHVHQDTASHLSAEGPASVPGAAADGGHQAVIQEENGAVTKPASSEPKAPSQGAPSTNSNVNIPVLNDVDPTDSSLDFSLPDQVSVPEEDLETNPKAPSDKPADIHEHAPPVYIEKPPSTKYPTGNPSQIHWTKPAEHFPVPTESYIKMPTGSPKPIPKIQFDFPRTEDPAAKALRENRQHAVLAEMKHAWSGYRTHAWMHDELAPSTATFKDPFCGWAATLVDSLDTLWIMGLKEEFDEAAKALKNIDFTYTSRDAIPVFETIIRYLGGLLAAFDVSGGADGDYPILLEKAVELAEILMGVFDTPNRMPITYYQWKPNAASQPHRAQVGSVAELGSMTMEFTRLAQLTGEQKYYDAIARIVNEFEGLQDRGTVIDGLFPERLDPSGCNKTATKERDKLTLVSEKKPTGFQPGLTVETSLEPTHELERRQLDARMPPLQNIALDVKDDYGEDWDCVPQPLSGVEFGRQSYSIGGSQDSTYEYYPKQHLLLGGLEPKYEKIHRKVMKGIKDTLLYRPMTNDSSDVLFAAKVTTGRHGVKDMDFTYEITHLACFLGGMFGMGSKIFPNAEELEMAKKITEGCVWAYRSMPSGIMPEEATVVPCDSMTECAWNETKWYEHIDRNWEYRDKQVALWEQQKALFLEENPQLVAASNASGSVKRSTLENAEAEEDAEAVNSEFDLEAEITKHIGYRPQGHIDFVESKITMENIAPGFVKFPSTHYILRPEAIESVWYMYRITGDQTWMEKGWKMWESIIPLVKTEYGHSALNNILSTHPRHVDNMESFWLAETLKYFYLLFSEPDVISLDEWVLNTEAHPFKRPTTAFGRGEAATKLQPHPSS